MLFATALLVFDDDYRISTPDPHWDDDRWRTLGMAEGTTLFVVHTVMEADGMARIISARRATKLKGSPMKSYVSKGITPEIAANLAEIETIRDEDIDLSDIPEVIDWSNAVRGGPFYRPVKQQLTLRLDADVVHWFKTHAEGERGYQTKINAALRRFVEEQVEQQKRA